jgi:hypothetical protein
LKTLGIQVSDLTQLDAGAANAVTLVGRKIEVTCDHESYQGKLRERWGIPRARKKIAPGAVRGLNDKFGHLLRSDEAAPQPPPPVREPNRSDEPF